MALVLIGMPASGKSTLGRLLAVRLGWEFIDTDRLIEAVTGEPVRELFLRDPVLFRLVERLVISNLPRRTEQVIAVGGGALDLLPPGRVVYLNAPEALLWERLVARGLPATLDPVDPRNSFHTMYIERTERYRYHADITLTIEPQNSSDQLVHYLEGLFRGQQ